LSFVLLTYLRIALFSEFSMQQFFDRYFSFQGRIGRARLYIRSI
jgi:hypothetical protein